MNDNGRNKQSSKQCKYHDECPWWHSGLKSLAASLWAFTLAVAWRVTFSYDGWTVSSALLLGFSLVLSVMISGVVMASESQQ